MKLPYIDNHDPFYFQKFPLWKDVSREEWDDWKWQLKNSVISVEQLSQIIPLSDHEKNMIQSTFAKYKFSSAPYYLSLMDPNNPECPIRLQAIPRAQELHLGEEDSADPLNEDGDMPVANVVHRYPDRVLVTITSVCSMYCRFCTRRRFVMDKEGHKAKNELDVIVDYISEHSEIRDVVISGGDALMMGEAMLETVLARIRAISHVEIIRIASKVPCVFPMRITEKLVKMIRKYSPIYFMTHFNHPYEITPESEAACAKIVDHGIPMMNQAVLLRKINSDAFIMKKLMQELLRIRVKPYYIYQCDLSEGIGHFRTPVQTGIEMIESLRGHTSGLAVPEFVVDVPGGGGKVPIMPQYLISQSDKKVVVRNFEGYIASYPQPEESDCRCSSSEAVRKTMTSNEELGLAKILHQEESISYRPKEV